MTRQRNDSHSTEFGLWLRKQKEIDSSLGYIASNIDYMWMNYKHGLWMLIEEKRYGKGLTFPQETMFPIIDKACKSDVAYRGLHVLVFERTNPDDYLWIQRDGVEITLTELMRLLKFE